MDKYLIMYSNRIADLDIPFLEVGNMEYLRLRLQFWKWRKKRTSGNSVLILWRNYDR